MNTAQDELIRRANTPSDINEHLHTLAALASECTHVTEFGHRTGNSTVAFIAGIQTPGMVLSYDIGQPSPMPERKGVYFEFHQDNTAGMPLIEETDMLFIDTLHDFRQVVLELRHAEAVRKYLVFHDTVSYGWKDESTGKPPGIVPGISAMCLLNPQWAVQSHAQNNNGLLVLRRGG